MKRSFRKKLVEEFRENTQAIVSSLLYRKRSNALYFSRSIMPSYPQTASHGLSHACPAHISHSVIHRCTHMQPRTLLGWHCPSTSPSVPITSWALKLPFPPLRAWSAKTAQWRWCSLPVSQENPKQLPAPRLISKCHPQLPSPLSLHTQQSLQPLCHTFPELPLTSLSS